MADLSSKELEDIARKLATKDIKNFTPYASAGAFFLRVEVRLPEPRVYKLKFSSATLRDKLREEVKKWRSALLAERSQ